LNVFWTVGVPDLGGDVAGFVVDDEEGIVDEVVNTVEAQLKLKSFDSDVSGDLSAENGKGCALGLVGEPLGDEVGEALGFEIEIAGGHAVAHGRGEPVVDGAVNV
jgi:hypothetical protein